MSRRRARWSGPKLPEEWRLGIGEVRSTSKVLGVRALSRLSSTRREQWKTMGGLPGVVGSSRRVESTTVRRASGSELGLAAEELGVEETACSSSWRVAAERLTTMPWAATWELRAWWKRRVGEGGLGVQGGDGR